MKKKSHRLQGIQLPRSDQYENTNATMVFTTESTQKILQPEQHLKGARLVYKQPCTQRLRIHRLFHKTDCQTRENVH